MSLPYLLLLLLSRSNSIIIQPNFLGSKVSTYCKVCTVKFLIRGERGLNCSNLGFRLLYYGEQRNRNRVNTSIERSGKRVMYSLVLILRLYLLMNFFDMKMTHIY